MAKKYRLTWEMVNPLGPKFTSTPEVIFDDHDELDFNARMDQFRQLKTWADNGQEGILWAKLEEAQVPDEVLWKEVGNGKGK